MSAGTGDSAARAVAAAILLACLGFYAVTTWHWPLVGDASLMHYVAFLMDHGMRPYRDIAEINMPGAMLVDRLVMHTLGGGSMAWRIFDLLLLGVGIAAMVEIARPRSWFAGLWAGVLLGLIHGRDGIFDAGQRDFVVAVLLLLGFAALFRATRGGWPGWAAVFGLCAGCAAAIKPTYLLLGPAVLVALAVWRGNGGGEITRSQLASYRVTQWSSYGVSGFAAPLVAVTLWLWRMGVLSDFVRVSRTLVAYHASLAHRSLGYLLLHSIAPLLPLVAVWVVVVVAFEREAWRSWERFALAIGVGVGLISYVAQAKGYPYQRYPLLALLLLVMGMDFAAATQRAAATRVLGWAAIAYGVLYLAPVSAWAASRYDWRNLEFQNALVADLDRLGGAGLPGQGLSGQVQCIDTIGGCQGALYRMRLVQSSGWMYDEFLFGAERGDVVAASRQRFWAAFEARPPRVIIVVDGLFPAGPAGFGKLALWPEFDAELERNYRIEDEVTPPDAVYWWARKDEPRSYRVYVRK
jgi:hypothetical protein